MAHPQPILSEAETSATLKKKELCRNKQFWKLCVRNQWLVACMRHSCQIPTEPRSKIPSLREQKAKVLRERRGKGVPELPQGGAYRALCTVWKWAFFPPPLLPAPAFSPVSCKHVHTVVGVATTPLRPLPGVPKLPALFLSVLLAYDSGPQSGSSCPVPEMGGWFGLV